jgi:hypothetical protein
MRSLLSRSRISCANILRALPSHNNINHPISVQERNDSTGASKNSTLSGKPGGGFVLLDVTHHSGNVQMTTDIAHSQETYQPLVPTTGRAFTGGSRGVPKRLRFGAQVNY